MNIGATTKEPPTSQAFDPIWVRSLFPGAANLTYLDVAARSLLSVVEQRAINEHVATRVEMGGNKPAMFAAIESARTKFARLINADRVEVAITKSVGDGINMISTAMPWKPGENIVVSSLEHPSNLYPWAHTCRLKNVELRVVPGEDGICDIGRIIESIDEQTKLVSLSTVTYAPGLRNDIASLSKACRNKGIFLLVDAAQSIGILHTDVESLGVDAIATSSQKGMLALYGTGFLYCRKEWAERLTPAFVGRFSIDLGKEHEAAFHDSDYSLMPGALRFEVGNYNYIGGIAVDSALNLLLKLGTEAIEAHAVGLAARLTNGLIDLGLPVVGSGRNPAERRTHIVCVGTFMPNANDRAEGDAMDSLAAFLRAQRIGFSIRRGLLRFSLHIYNNRDDVDRVLELVRQWQKQSSRSLKA